MTLMEKLKEAGYPEADMFHHGTDLYIFATPQTKKVVIEWFVEKGLDPYVFVSIFRDIPTDRLMYDIAFQYDPAWSGRG